MMRFIEIIVMTVLLVAASASSLLASTDVKLRERALPRTSVVRLGDVAEIESADRQQARQLAAAPLMPAPAAGTQRFLRVREIQDMLAAQGVDIGDIRFQGAEQVELEAANPNAATSSGRKSSDAARRPMNQHEAILAGLTSPSREAALDGAQSKLVRDALEAVIAGYLGGKSGRACRVECDLTDKQLAQVNAATSAPVCTGGNEPWTGRQRILISFATSDGPMQMPVLVNVTPPPILAVVAVRPIAKGDVIRAADVELRTIEAPTKGSNQRAAADSVERLVGMEAKQAIQANDIVFTDAVQSPILVKRGEIITVASQSGGIRVRTTARALQDGSRGDLLQVESLKSKEKFDVRVVGTREAAIFTISHPAASEPPVHIETANR